MLNNIEYKINYLKKFFCFHCSADYGDVFCSNLECHKILTEIIEVMENAAAEKEE